MEGAHDMDGHFVETNPRHNLPVLMALSDVWNDSFLGSTGRIITPWTEAFAAFPSFCAALEAQTCGNSNDVKHSSSVVIDGGLHYSYDRSQYQSCRVLPSELVMAMDTQVASHSSISIGADDIYANQDALMCSLFAHADEMAFGNDVKASGSLSAVMDGRGIAHETDAQVSEGNRPSMLVMCDKCDAFTCGQLVALAEHRAVVKARIWDINPFALEVGSSLRSKRTEKLKEDLHKMLNENADEAEDGEIIDASAMNLSTRTILKHYATLMKDQRLYVVK